MKTYFIIYNTVSEYHSQITAIRDTFEDAKEKLKECSDWYCSKGSGTIKEVTEEMKVLKKWEFNNNELIDSNNYDDEGGLDWDSVKLYLQQAFKRYQIEVPEDELRDFIDWNFDNGRESDLSEWLERDFDTFAEEVAVNEGDIWQTAEDFGLVSAVEKD